MTIDSPARPTGDRSQLPVTASQSAGGSAGHQRERAVASASGSRNAVIPQPASTSSSTAPVSWEAAAAPRCNVPARKTIAASASVTNNAAPRSRHGCSAIAAVGAAQEPEPRTPAASERLVRRTANSGASRRQVQRMPSEVTKARQPVRNTADGSAPGSA